MNKVITADLNGACLYNNKIEKDNLVTSNLEEISNSIKEFINCNNRDIVIVITGPNMNIQKVTGECLTIHNYLFLFDFAEFRDLPIQMQRYLNINCVVRNKANEYLNEIKINQKYHRSKVKSIACLTICAGIFLTALGNYVYNRVEGLKDDDYEDIPPQPQAELNIETPPPTTAIEEFLEISPKEEIKEKLENVKPLETMATPNIQKPIEEKPRAIQELLKKIK